MNESYWEKIASDYDNKIFDSLTSDRKGILLQRLDGFANPSATAADAGCGIGKYLPALAGRFSQVDAYDLSPNLLKLARANTSQFSNIRYFKRNFAVRSARVSPVCFALCTNVLIMADTTTRETILRTLSRLVESGGHALFLIPSLESALLTHHRLVQWNRRDGMKPNAANRASTAPAAQASRFLAQGLVSIDGIPTKHYLREEAVIFLRDFAFEPLQIDKVEYSWDTEFETPPRWMRDPYPWDWLISARRK